MRSSRTDQPPVIATTAWWWCGRAFDVRQGQQQLFNDAKAFSYITNDWKASATKIVTEHATQRCQQENVIEQNKNGVHALSAPLNNLKSNWAYMVIASLAWSLKAWSALLLPINGRDKLQREKAKHTDRVARPLIEPDIGRKVRIRPLDATLGPRVHVF